MCRKLKIRRVLGNQIELGKKERMCVLKDICYKCALNYKQNNKQNSKY